MASLKMIITSQKNVSNCKEKAQTSNLAIREQAWLSWGSGQAETVILQLQAKQTSYTNQALSKSNSLGLEIGEIIQFPIKIIPFHVCITGFGLISKNSKSFVKEVFDARSGNWRNNFVSCLDNFNSSL